MQAAAAAAATAMMALINMRNAKAARNRDSYNHERLSPLKAGALRVDK
jgi:hypothetical protein